MRSNNNNKLKAYVRFDGSGRIVPSSLIVQSIKPKDGNWKEIDSKECCNYTTTTTTTAAPTTTTTTTVVVNSVSAYGANVEVDACNEVNGTAVTVYYTGGLNTGTALFMDSGLTTPYNPSVSGTYLRIYFAAQVNTVLMSGNIMGTYNFCTF